MDIDV